MLRRLIHTQEPIDGVIDLISNNFDHMLLNDREYFEDLYNRTLTDEEKIVVGAMAALSEMAPTEFLSKFGSIMEETKEIKAKIYNIFVKEFLYQVNYTVKPKP